MIIVVDLTGDYDTSLQDAAAWLVANGIHPNHYLEIRRDGCLSVSGQLGELARYRPVSSGVAAPVTAKWHSP